MTDFECRENGEFVLEEDREQGSYRWVTLEIAALLHRLRQPADWRPPTPSTSTFWRWLPFTSTSARSTARRWTCCSPSTSCTPATTTRSWPRRLGLNTTLETLVQMPGSQGDQLRAVADAGPGRGVPPAVPAERRDAHQRLPDPHRPVPRGADQRLLHGAAVLGPPAGKTFIESYRNQRKICQELVDSHILPAVIRPLAQAIAQVNNAKPRRPLRPMTVTPTAQFI